MEGPVRSDARPCAPPIHMCTMFEMKHAAQALLAMERNIITISALKARKPRVNAHSCRMHVGNTIASTLGTSAP